MKKVSSFILISMLLCVSVTLIFNIFSGEGLSSEGTFVERFENAAAENIPFKDELNAAMDSILYASGVRHFGDIYIGNEGSLLRDIEKPTGRTFSAAKNYILSYSSTNQIKPYFMLVPTASVILQQEIDSFANENIYNQRYMISQMYSQFEGGVRTADVYQTLYDRRGEYIYYHTEDMPTSLGGYYIYGELCSRLGIKQNTMDFFSAAYAAHGFYGSLATDFFRPYANSDYVSLYEYTGEKSGYIVEHYSGGKRIKVINNLFIYNEDTYDDKTDMILGGISPVMHITRRENAEEKASILIFGDETAKSWIPFLVSNYGKITFVHLDLADEKLLSEVKTADYDQVLFAYSAAKFSSGIDFSKLEYVG